MSNEIYYATSYKAGEIHSVSKAPPNKTIDYTRGLIKQENDKIGREQFILLEGIAGKIAAIKISEQDSYKDNVDGLIGSINSLEHELYSVRSELELLREK